MNRHQKVRCHDEVDLPRQRKEVRLIQTQTQIKAGGGTGSWEDE